MAVILPVREIAPKFGRDCFLAENATVVGDVEMGDHCSVWFNAVIRGDVHYVKIGNNTNIQDGAIIHCTYMKAPTNIGSNVSIAHNAVVHGCTIEDNVLIGIGAIILDNAIIKSGAVIAAGAVVLSNTVVEPDSIYAGIPARKIKKIDDDFKKNIEKTAKNYLMYAKWYK